jgi:hypothetical protein
VSNVLDKDPGPLGTLAPQHKALEPIVNRLLAKRAGDRYPTAGDLSDVLAPITRATGSFRERLRRLF